MLRSFLISHRARSDQTLKRDTLLDGWLYRTAGFVSREFMRNSARRKQREEQAHIMNESNDQETTQVWSELKPELDDALMALPAKHRNVVVLRYLRRPKNSCPKNAAGCCPSRSTPFAPVKLPEGLEI